MGAHCHVSVFIFLPHGSVLVPRLLVGNVVKTLWHTAAWRSGVECAENYIYQVVASPRRERRRDSATWPELLVNSNPVIWR